MQEASGELTPSNTAVTITIGYGNGLLLNCTWSIPKLIIATKMKYFTI